MSAAQQPQDIENEVIENRVVGNISAGMSPAPIRGYEDERAFAARVRAMIVSQFV